MIKTILCGLLFLGILGEVLTSESEAARPSKQKIKPRKIKPVKKEGKKPTSPTQGESEENVIRFPGTTPIKLRATHVIVMDYATGRVLLEKNADQPMTPSSMVKMMTAYLLEQKIQKGQVSHETMFHVSENAWRKGGAMTDGSTMYLPLNSQVSLGDLLKGIIISSGNDACIVAAEGVSGSEAHFVDEMNAKAREFGLQNTVFKNSSGLPEEGQQSTARDLALLGIRLIRDFPKAYEVYKQEKFRFNNIEQGNRNPLLTKDVGCDGIKTGHTSEGGYGITASFVDGGQRYVMVLNGLSTMNARAMEAMKILNWIKQNFVNRVIFKKGDIVEKAAPVWLGIVESIPLKAGGDVSLLVPRSEQNKVEMKVVYDSPLHAPLEKDQVVGKIMVHGDSVQYEVPLLASESVTKVGLFTRFWRSIQYLLWGSA